MNKNPVYISFNLAEYQVLFDKASFPEMAMYFILKKMANFKSGEVGSFRQQKLNYEKLATLLSRPVRNTAPAEIYDRGQARNILGRLERIGLVTNIRIENEALKMRLPLSPMHDVTEVIPENAPSPLSPTDKPVQEPTNFFDGWLDVTASCDDDPFAINTDKNHQYNQNHHISHTAAVCTARDNSQGDTPSPSATGRIHPPSFGKKEGSATLTTADIVAELKNAGGFRLLDHSVSLAIFKGWEKIGVQMSELKQAISKMHDEGGYDLIPGELDKIMRAGRRSPCAGTGRGTVSL